MYSIFHDQVLSKSSAILALKPLHYRSKRPILPLAPTSFQKSQMTPLSVRRFSQSTSIPKKLQRVRDHSFDAIMDVEKKTRTALKLQSLILSHPNSTLPISLLDSLARRHLHFSPHDAGSFLLSHPHAFHVYDHPVQRILWVRLTPLHQAQIDRERRAIEASTRDGSAVTRLKRLLLLATPECRLRLEHIRIARWDLGLPEDFEDSVILAHPSSFRLIAPMDGDPRMKYVEAVVDPDEEMPVSAIERAREKEYRARGSDAEDARFAFLINFPPGFKIGKYFRIAMWKWQRLPYWSPYEDVSGYDLRSLEARKRMEKRVVATIHEILSLMVEKRTTMERIAHFRQAMGLPKKLKEFLLQHQGIFYVSTRGNQGKLHTVFLREAYRKGEMVELNDVYLARRKLGELLLMSPKKANVDRMLTSLGRESRRFQGEEEEGDSDSGVESQFME